MNVSEWEFQSSSQPERDAWYALWAQVYAEQFPGEDVPPFEVPWGYVVGSPDFRVTRLWRALSHDGELLGVAQLDRDTSGDNTHRAEIELTVAPSARRRGAGTALLRPVAHAAEEAGCTVLGFETMNEAVAMSFLARYDARSCIADTRSVLDTSLVDRDDVAACAVRPGGASAYSLVSWDGVPPAELLEPYAVVSTSMNDAPMGDMRWNKESADAARLEAWLQCIVAKGDAIWTICAKRDGTGELAGLTEVVLPASWPEHIFQENTGVLRPHRGHGLGLWMKAVMLQRILAERPDVRFIETWNASENEHMLRVNRRLGFRPANTAAVLELDVDVAVKRLAS
jgi:GNAT superfamily N-acetyltransferase